MGVICASQVPDHSTLARFRRDHEDALADLFTEVLALCGKAGLLNVGVIAVDGTTLHANASDHSNLTYEQIAGSCLSRFPAVSSWARSRSAACERRLDYPFGVAVEDRLRVVLAHLALASTSRQEIVAALPGAVCFDSFLVLSESGDSWIWLRKLGDHYTGERVEHSGMVSICHALGNVVSMSDPDRASLLAAAGRTALPRCRVVCTEEAQDATMTLLHDAQSAAWVSGELSLYIYVKSGLTRWTQRLESTERIESTERKSRRRLGDAPAWTLEAEADVQRLPSLRNLCASEAARHVPMRGGALLLARHFVYDR